MYVRFRTRLLRRFRSDGGRLWRCWPICNIHYQITWNDAIRAHDEALVDGGAPGILNEHAVRSAISRPYCGYFESLHEKASALIHGIVFNHGFVDGNKRTSFYLAELLIYNSGYILSARDEAMVSVITAVARGEMTREELAEWLKDEIIVESNQ